jgi:O-acetyl-ADP-ribose deacetylase (regulator of RNase III)
MSGAVYSRLSIIQGDITHQQADAIVNAANNSLLGGGGVDGAIHRAAGPKLLEECKALHGCATGDAKITQGYALPARKIIHTVGPVWNDGRHQEEQLLASCYKKSLELARLHNVSTLAFPSISTGMYRFPVERASRIALQEIVQGLAANPAMKQVTVVCFDEATYRTYKSTEQELLEKKEC